MSAVETINLAELPRFAEALARVDMRPWLGKIASKIVAYHTQERFDTETAPDGTPWPPLKSPRSGKRHKKSNPKPLQDTGLLKASISARGAENIQEVTDTSLTYGTAVFTYGTAVEYAGFHQEGTRTIPARPFLGIDEEMAEELAESALEYAARQMGGA